MLCTASTVFFFSRFVFVFDPFSPSPSSVQCELFYSSTEIVSFHIGEMCRHDIIVVGGVDEAGVAAC